MRAYKTNSIRSTYNVLMILVAILLLNISAAIAQSETKITADDAAGWDTFGCSVSISGDYAIIGAYGNSDDGWSSGSAYIFIRDGEEWTQQAKLIADDAAAEDWFGISVSISGDYAVVGAFRDDDGGRDAGSAYIFIRDGADWNQQAKLTADDAAWGDGFGISVSISGDYAVVGAYCDDRGSGSAYIFVHYDENWTEQAKLTADDAARSDWFGSSVSISGDYAVVGAYKDDDDGEASGSAYIFVRDGGNWTQQAKLTADDAEEGDQFGHSVSISGDYVVVGVWNDDDDGSNSGSVYIFVQDGEEWTQQTKLTAEDAAERDHFGCSVSIDGDYAVIGAVGDDSAYIFVHDDENWTEQAKLTANDADDWLGESFGCSVSISGDYAVVGTPGDDDGAGSAYIYNLGENNIEWRGDIPVDFGIVSAYPNPFNSAIRIGFNLKSAHEVVLQALDIQGRVVSEIFQGYYQAGQHQMTWDAQSFQSGLYFIKLQSGDNTSMKKVIMIK